MSMSRTRPTISPDPDPEPVPGLPAAPGGEAPRRRTFGKVVKMIELRLRFVVLLAATGAVFGYWDAIQNFFETRSRPQGKARAGGDAAGIEYFCPMHPDVRAERAATCPICGMTLSRRQKGAREAFADGVLSRLRLSSERVAQGGIRTVEVAYAPLVETLTTLGEVDYDESRLAVVASEVKGMARVDQLEAGSSGVEVRAGQALAELFNLELAQGIRDLLVARRSAQPAPGAPKLGRGPDEAIRLASDALRLAGVRPSQIDAILRRSKDDYRLPVLAPVSGHVVKKGVVEGQYVPEGAVLFEIADLGRVWVRARVDEDQLARVRVGQAIVATVPAFPGEEFAGQVALIAPVVDSASRTAEVRASLDNPDLKLRPGMSARVTLQSRAADLAGVRARPASASPDAVATRRAILGTDEQEVCPVSNLKLGSMGAPFPVEVEGKKVWVCCEGCAPKLKAAPARYLARLAPPPGDAVLSVPESAVIDTGTRTVVYVETSPGVFEGRAVKLAPRSGDRYPVLEGLAAGERVAAEGAFLIDAETRLDPSARPEPPAGREPR